MARFYQGSDEEIESWRPTPTTSRLPRTPPKRPLPVSEVYTDTSSGSSPPPKKGRKEEQEDSCSSTSSEVVAPTPSRPTRISLEGTPSTSLARTSAPSLVLATKTSVAPVQGAQEESKESDSGSETYYENEEAFFTEQQPTTPRHKWLVAFFKHLATPDAGFHRDRNR